MRVFHCRVSLSVVCKCTSICWYTIYNTFDSSANSVLYIYTKNKKNIYIYVHSWRHHSLRDKMLQLTNETFNINIQRWRSCDIKITNTNDKWDKTVLRNSASLVLTRTHLDDCFYYFFFFFNLRNSYFNFVLLLN